MKTTILVFALVPFLFATFVIGSEAEKPTALNDIFTPVVVGTPPSDAFTGLIRLPDGEIRHYGGGGFIFSRDDGLTWERYRLGEKDADGNVKRGGGAGAVSPKSGAYVRIQGMKSGTFAFRSADGIDGESTRRKIDDRRFIMIRPPIFLKSRKRVLFAAHTPTRPHRIGVFRSDDDGKTWEGTMLPPGPRFEVKPPHRQPRWENRCVEPTVLELDDGRLWMIARTSQDRHYQCFSKDGGESWSPWMPSPFYGTLTMPTLFRLSDGRILFFWCNTTPLPEADRRGSSLPKTACDGTWEDVFTNRDAFHAAVSDDEGKTWRGFREIRLNPFRDAADYGDRTKRDWSVHQAQAVELPQGKVLVADGQDANVRRLVIFDSDWLLEKGRKTGFENGLDDWSSFKYVKGIRGHCAYNRAAGCALVRHPDVPGRRVMQIRHPIDEQLVFDRDGATWNFPAAVSGSLQVRVKPLSGGKGGRICLLERWINPTDPVVEDYATYVLRFDGEGRVGGKSALRVDAWNTLSFRWENSETGECVVGVEEAGVSRRLPCRRKSVHGLSYAHFQSPAEGADSNGYLVESVEAAGE